MKVRPKDLLITNGNESLDSEGDNANVGEPRRHQGESLRKLKNSTK